jgi:hypothetical protein
MTRGHTAQASRPCWKNQRHRDLIEHFGNDVLARVSAGVSSVRDRVSASSIAASMTPQRLPVHCAQPDALTAEQMTTVQRDAEIMAALLRDHPDDIRSLCNDMIAGRIDSAKETALRVGLSESGFKMQGGGMWPYIVGFGVCILIVAAVTRPE